jgi:hypothetical protein
MYRKRIRTAVTVHTPGQPKGKARRITLTQEREDQRRLDEEIRAIESKQRATRPTPHSSPRKRQQDEVAADEYDAPFGGGFSDEDDYQDGPQSEEDYITDDDIAKTIETLSTNKYESDCRKREDRWAAVRPSWSMIMASRQPVPCKPDCQPTRGTMSSWPVWLISHTGSSLDELVS